MIRSLQQAKRIVKVVIGFTILLIGLAMTVLPGPAIVVIPAGLAILATEFLWARRLLDRIKKNRYGSYYRKSYKDYYEDLFLFIIYFACVSIRTCKVLFLYLIHSHLSFNMNTLILNPAQSHIGALPGPS